MADIRLTPLLDDFSGSAQDPIAYPWVTPIDSAIWQTQRMKRSGGGNLSPAGTGYPFSTYAAFTRPDVILKGDTFEMWGISADANDLREGHAFGMVSAPGYAGQCIGYICRATSEITNGWMWTLRRYITGQADYVTLGTLTNQGQILGGGQMALMRRVGSNVQCWHGTADGQTWTLKFNVADTNYMAPPYAMWPCLGIQTDDGTGPSWTALGGGRITPQESQIIRYVSN